MGFRSYSRQFLAAILMLFRPSLPWGFAAGSGSIFCVAPCYRSSRSRSSSSRSSRKQEEKVATIIFSYRFQKIQKSSRSRSSSSRKQEEKVAIIIFFYGFQKSSRRSSSSRRKQKEKVAKIIFFLWVFRSYIRQFLGAILMLFPSFTAMGICCCEWFDFWRWSLPPE